MLKIRNMIKPIYLILLFSTIGFSQEFGLNKLTSSLSKVDKQPTLIKSEFNNLTLDFDDDKNDLVSPSYSTSYLYFRDDKIGFWLTKSDIHKEPFFLTQIKLIKKDLDEKKLTLYSIEGDFIYVDYESNQIKWTSERDKSTLTYVFQNLSLGNDSELKECIETFNFKNIPVSNLSPNSQNLIGLSEEEVIFRYSKHYEQPRIVEGQPFGKISDSNDTILMFRAIDDNEIRNFVVLNEHKICKYLITFYPNDYLESISSNYTKIFGKQTNTLEWTERSGNKKYSYFIDIASFDDKFVIHTKQLE